LLRHRLRHVIKRVLRNQIRRVAVWPQGLPDRLIALPFVAFALLLAHAVQATEFELHPVLDRIHRAEDSPELVFGRVGSGQLSAEMRATCE